MKRQSVIGGAVLLCLAGIICKFLGGISRIVLTNILGVEGIGIYQLLFPIFSLAVVLTQGGLPLAQSRAISQSENGDEKACYFSASLKVALWGGILISLFVAAASPIVPKIYGHNQYMLLVLSFCPSILFCALIGAFRGKFQGERNMLPTSISQIVEQLSKLLASISLAFVLVKKGFIYGVLGAIWGIFISEALTFFTLYVFNRHQFVPLKKSRRIQMSKAAKKSFYKCVAAFTLLGSILPLSALIESVVALNLIKLLPFQNAHSATALFGLYGGVAGALISLPCTFAVALQTALVPAKRNDDFKDVSIALKYVLLVALPCALAFLSLPQNIIGLIFPRVAASASNFSIACRLLQICALNVVFMSLTTVCTSIYQARGNLKVPIYIFAGMLILKLVLSVCFIYFAKLSIFGLALASLITNFAGMILSYMLLNECDKKVPSLVGLLGANEIMVLLFIFAEKLNLTNTYFSLFVLFAVLVYFLLIVSFKVIKKSDLVKFRRKNSDYLDIK